MKVNSKGEHAVTTLLEMALRHPDEPVTVHEICKSRGISESYLEQILRLLKTQGLVEGLRGPGGGYRLTRRASDISVAEVLLAVEGKDIHESHAAEGNSEKDSTNPDDLWRDLSDMIFNFLDGMTLGDLVKLAVPVKKWPRTSEKTKRKNFILPRPISL